MTGDEIPAFPVSWRRPHIAYAPGIAGLGLGLFGLREVPFVGREGERDAIWNALHLVIGDGRCRAVLLRGASGAGKSRMAQWVCQRADELGGFTVLRAVHAIGRRQGLQDLLERYFVAHALDDREELRVHVRARLGRLCPDAEAEFLDGETAAISAILMPEESARASVSERIAVVTRVLARVAEIRPVLLWLDDVQWDHESIALALHLVENATASVLVLLTIQEEAAAELPDVELALSALVSHDAAGELTVHPLDEADQTELVGRLIGLEHDVCREVSLATSGNPLFAVHLVGDWVERGLLLATRTGFVLRDGASTPEDLHTLWARRLEHICGLFGGPRSAQQASLELAAALGGGVRTDEWEAACAAASLIPDERLLPTLTNQGMIIEEPDGWRFVHRLLAASLKRLSVEAGRWSGLQGHCGDALAELYRLDVVAERRAAHYLEAERWPDALPPLKSAVWNRFASRDYHEAAELVGEHARALAAAALGDEVPGVDQMLMDAILSARTRGSTDSTAFDEVVKIAEPRGWDLQLGIALREKGAAVATEARLDEALDLYMRAEVVFSRVDSPAEQASLFQGRAWVYKAQGDTASAQRDLERALDIHRHAGDKMRELNAVNSLAFTFLAEGDYVSSREIAQMGVELGRALGHRGAEAGCWTTLGEIARFEGALDRARDCYRRAASLDMICGSKHVHLVHANAAMVEVAAREWDNALSQFDIVEPIMVAGGDGWMSPFFALARSCCYAGKGDLQRCDEFWADAVKRIDAAKIVERDVAWLAEIAASIADDKRDVERGERALRYALRHWEELGDEPEIRGTRARLRALGLTV